MVNNTIKSCALALGVFLGLGTIANAQSNLALIDFCNTVTKHEEFSEFKFDSLEGNYDYLLFLANFDGVAWLSRDSVNMQSLLDSLRAINYQVDQPLFKCLHVTEYFRPDVQYFFVIDNFELSHEKFKCNLVSYSINNSFIQVKAEVSGFYRDNVWEFSSVQISKEERTSTGLIDELKKYVD